MKFFDFSIKKTLQLLEGNEFKTIKAHRPTSALIKKITDQNEANILVVNPLTFRFFRTWDRDSIYETEDKNPLCILSNKYKTEIHVSNEVPKNKMYFLKTMNMYDDMDFSQHIYEVNDVILESVIVIEPQIGNEFV